MTGLEDWEFPIEFAAIDGDNVVVKWIQVLPGGGRRVAATSSPARRRWSTRVTASSGYQEDLLNMVHVLEDLKESGWTPGPGSRSTRPSRTETSSRP